MRALLLFGLLFGSELHAQTVAPPHMGRPSFAVAGRETMPQMLLDEGALSAERYERIPLPPEIWAEMKRCAAKEGFRVRKDLAPPEVLVVPVARTIRVHDLTLDSLLYVEDTSFAGEQWSPPTVGYALVQSNIILVTAPYRDNKYLLRHEALHFIAWHARKILGHPARIYEPCDRSYE